MCVQKAALLDGTIDCLDGEDESPKHTVSGENEGVVQFKYFLNGILYCLTRKRIAATPAQFHVIT